MLKSIRDQIFMKILEALVELLPFYDIFLLFLMLLKNFHIRNDWTEFNEN